MDDGCFEGEGWKEVLQERERWTAFGEMRGMEGISWARGSDEERFTEARWMMEDVRGRGFEG